MFVFLTDSGSDLAPCPKTIKDTSEDSDSLSLESQENVTSAQPESNATVDEPFLFNSDFSTNASKSLFSDPDSAESQWSCRNDSYAFLPPPTSPTPATRSARTCKRIDRFGNNVYDY